jgi:hypothetical protein
MVLRDFTDKLAYLSRLFRRYLDVMHRSGMFRRLPHDFLDGLSVNDVFTLKTNITATECFHVLFSP